MTLGVPPVAPRGSLTPPAFGPAYAPSPCKLISERGSEWFLSAAKSCVWDMRPGVAPFVGEFTTMRDRAEAWLANVRGNEWVSFEWDGRAFERLVVLRAIQPDPWHVTIRVADRRHRWRYRRYFGRHNLRRQVNDRTLLTELALDPETGEEAGVAIGPDQLRDDLDSIAEQRYREWSTKDDGVPFTAAELCGHVLRALMLELDEEGLDEASLVAAPDNGEVVDQQEYLGQPYPEVLGGLLRRAELALAVDQDGAVRLYDPFAIPQFPSAPVKGGAMRTPDLSRIRPAVVEVFALPERARACVASTPSAVDEQLARQAEEEIDTPPGLIRDDQGRDVVPLFNVIKLPLATTINGVERNADEWVFAADAIAAFGFTEDAIRDGWFFGGEGLKLKYARRVRAGAVYYDPVVMRYIGAVMGHYRQSYMIAPVYRDRVREWRAEDAAVVSRQTHRRQKSPVYTEWYDLFPAIPLIQRRGPADKVGSNESSWKGSDDVDLTTPQTAPARLSEEDQDLGVLRIDMRPAIDGGVAERIPSQVLNPPEVFTADVRRLIIFFTKNSKLAESRRVETVISCIEGTPNATESDPLAGKRAFVVARFRVTEGRGADVAKLQLTIRGDTARYNTSGELVNGEQIRALARAEALAAVKSYEDRPLGILTVAHERETEWKLQGHLQSLRFVRDTRGDDTVVINAGEPPPDRKPLRFLPQRVKDFLFRRLPLEE